MPAHSARASMGLRILVRNTLAWPQIKKQTVFPDDSNSVCFTCKAFYTSAARMVLIPSAQLTLDDMPVPDADITKVLKAPAVKINVVKYASLVRGDTACSLKGSLSCIKLLFPPCSCVSFLYAIFTGIMFCLKLPVSGISVMGFKVCFNSKEIRVAVCIYWQFSTLLGFFPE